MKRTILLCVALFVMGAGLNAQARFGIKAGANLMNYQSDKDESGVSRGFKSGMGFQFGGMMEYKFTDNISLAPELLFVMTNAKDVTDTKYAVNQIQLPINLKYTEGEDNFKYFGTLGAYAGMGLSAKAKKDGNSGDLYEGDNAWKKFDMGVAAGVGVEVSKFVVSLNYQLGLLNLTKGKDAGGKEFKLKHSGFVFSVGYFF